MDRPPTARHPAVLSLSILCSPPPPPIFLFSLSPIWLSGSQNNPHVKTSGTIDQVKRVKTGNQNANTERERRRSGRLGERDEEEREGEADGRPSGAPIPGQSLSLRLHGPVLSLSFIPPLCLLPPSEVDLLPLSYFLKRDALFSVVGGSRTPPFPSFHLFEAASCRSAGLDLQD